MNVFLDKLGLSDEKTENPAMQWGKILEPVIASRYEEETGSKLKKGEFVCRGIYGGTPDYLSESKLIEIKTAGQYTAHSWGEEGTDHVPESYLCQVQWYMMLTDMQKADLAVLIGGNDYRVYHINRNDELLGLMKNAADKFWNTHIVTEVPPPLDSSNGTQEYLKSIYPNSRGNIVSATEPVADLAYVYHKLCKELKDIEEKKISMENQLKYEIGDNEGIKHATFKATWKSTKDGERINYESLVKGLNIAPELVKEFTVAKPGYRRFIFNYLGE
jgi:putative phage-type endonuclease